MGGLARYCEDLLAHDALAPYERVFLAAGIPRRFRPDVHTRKATRNFVLRDGAVNASRQIAWAWRCGRQLNELMTRERFDILHLPSTMGWGFWRNAMHVHYAKRHGVKVLWHLLGQIDDFWHEGGAVQHRLVTRALDMADVHVVQSDKLRDLTAGLTHRPVRAIFNGVRAERLRPPDGYAHSDPAEGKVRVITLGFLGHKKGHYDLIEAGKTLCGEFPELEFLFVGGGAIGPVRQRIDAAGLADRIRIVSDADDAECVRLLHAADIFALPSYAEGQPIALLEAMAAGLPVLSSTVGSIPEVVGERNGLLVRPGDVAAITDGLREMVRSPARRKTIGSHNAVEGREKYSLDRTMRQIGEVYEWLLRAKR